MDSTLAFDSFRENLQPLVITRNAIYVPLPFPSPIASEWRSEDSRVTYSSWTTGGYASSY